MHATSNCGASPVLQVPVNLDGAWQHLAEVEQIYVVLGCFNRRRKPHAKSLQALSELAAAGTATKSVAADGELELSHLESVRSDDEFWGDGANAGDAVIPAQVPPLYGTKVALHSCAALCSYTTLEAVLSYSQLTLATPDRGAQILPH